MIDFFRYIFFRTEAWTVTGALFMVCIYLTTVLDASRPRDPLSVMIGTLLAGMIGAGLTGGLCAALWQTMRLITGHRVPNAPRLFAALVGARPTMWKAAVIGFGICFVIGLVMTALFMLTNEKTGMFLGSRIAWQLGCGVAGGALGAGIASIPALLRQVVAG